MPMIRRSRHLNKVFLLGAVTFSLTYFFLQSSPTSSVRLDDRETDWEVRSAMGTTRHSIEEPGSVPAQLPKPNVNANVEISPILPHEADKVLHEAGLVKHRMPFTEEKSSSIQNVHQETTPTPVINPHPFSYVLHPGNACSHNDTYLFVYIHSAPTHYKHRLLIRQTWGNPNSYLPIGIRLVFILGLSKSEQTNAAVRYEADMYKDIVQEDFVDSYKNLTYKGVAGLRYVSQNCKTAAFVMKTDDDVVVNVFALLHRLQTVPKDKLIMCLTWYHMKVMREPRSKWYVSKAEWQPDEYPPYCSGSAFVLTPDVATKALSFAPHTPYFWVDDLYVTGLLAQKAGITNHLNIRPRYELNFGKFDTAYDQQRSDLDTLPIFTHARSMPLSQLHRLWSKIVAKAKLDIRWLPTAG